MRETQIVELKKIKARKPILVEGLPGIGYVGKLAADHLIIELGAEKFAELYSPYFMHQALIEEDSTMRLMKNEFWYVKKENLVILVGDVQPTTPDSYGHYEVVQKILDYIKTIGIKRIYTMGGSSTGGVVVKEPRVFGAATSTELVEMGKTHGMTFKADPGAAIVGASGLILAMGMHQGFEGICLLGESPGYLIDAKAAKAVLNVLASILGIEVDMSALEQRASETEEFITKVQEMERKSAEQTKFGPERDIGYIR
jgi:uncharacterized protein (TIGR00162 family)